MPNVNKRPTAPPLLIDAHALGRLLDRSVASINRDVAAGCIPAPVKLGGSRRWRLAEVEAWIAAGCPAQAPPGPEDDEEAE